MKKRMNKIMHDLNISLETANAALRGSKAMGVKSYSINSVVSGKDEEKLQQKFGYKDKAKAHKQRPDVNSSDTPLQKSSKGNNIPKPTPLDILKSQTAHLTTTKGQKKRNSRTKATVEKPLTFSKYMKAPRHLNTCQNRFFFGKIVPKQAANIRETLRNLLGEEYIGKEMPLFKVVDSTNKTYVVKYKYYYFSITGRRTLVKEECFATWIACALSEAVNKGHITKMDYHLFVKTYLSEVLKSKKKKTKSAKKRQWVSIVSVPFGGMNRR